MAQIGHFVFFFGQMQNVKIKKPNKRLRQETISNIFKNQTKIKAGVAKSSIQKLFSFFYIFYKIKKAIF